MTHLPEIWKCIKKNLRRGIWTDIEDIYQLVESQVQPDAEDYEWQSPS